MRIPPPPPVQDAQGCNFFAWDRMTGYCWLKRTDGLRIPHPKMIIGPKFCANMASNPHTPTPKEACSVTASQVSKYLLTGSKGGQTREIRLVSWLDGFQI